MPPKAAGWAIFLLTPVLAPITLILGIPKLVIRKLGLVPDEPKQESAPRVAAADDDVPSQLKVIDPRQGTPWYLDVASPGLFFHALPLVVLWWASQL